MKSLNIKGCWKAFAGLSLVEIVVNQNADRIFGVATVSSLFGQEDLYHFDGSVSGDVVKATHHNGRSFEGKVINSRLIQGILTLKSGMKLKLSAKRVVN